MKKTLFLTLGLSIILAGCFHQTPPVNQNLNQNVNLSNVNINQNLNQNVNQNTNTSLPVEPAAKWTIYEIGEYNFKYPANWQTVLDDDRSIYFNDGANTVMILNCPIVETGYQAWTLETESRQYQGLGGDIDYGVDLWLGTPKSGTDVKALAIIFMHRNDFDNWAGEDNQDFNSSCQLLSMNADGKTDIFREIYNSVR